jgi:hypothetical protein
MRYCKLSGGQVSAVIAAPKLHKCFSAAYNRLEMMIMISEVLFELDQLGFCSGGGGGYCYC